MQNAATGHDTTERSTPATIVTGFDHPPAALLTPVVVVVAPPVVGGADVPAVVEVVPAAPPCRPPHPASMSAAATPAMRSAEWPRRPFTTSF
jgi:hypothetical protein